MTIHRLAPDEIAASLPALSALLEDCVEGGASIGFLWPMSDGEAAAYWRSCVAPVTGGSRVLLVARDDAGAITGTAQLDLATRANSLHRAEVAKLMVLRSARLLGTGRALMLALEDEARRHKRTTLVLDTFLDGGAEPLYRALGWTEAGRVPLYATWPDGTLGTTVYYYKLL
jgi:GNAT superfamily N-acetyltransferase